MEAFAGPLGLNGKTIGVASIESDAANNFFLPPKIILRFRTNWRVSMWQNRKNGDAILISPLRFVSYAPLNYKVNKNEVHTLIIESTILKGKYSHRHTF